MPGKIPSIAPVPPFREQGLRFLRSLRRNNRREWFNPRKPEFERELREPMLALIGTGIAQLWLGHTHISVIPAHPTHVPATVGGI